MLQDVRLAFRMMARDRWFTLVALLVLSLGIGVNAMVFTLANAVLFKGLPFPESHQLYMLGWRSDEGAPTSVSWPELLEWRDQSRAFAGLAAFTNRGFNISDDRGLPEQARGASLTANAFGVLRQRTLLGRDFTSDDERRGAQAVVILGHTLWRNRYGADPDIVGTTIRLDGEPATVIGIMPGGMQFPSTADLWTPIRPTSEQEQQRASRFLNVFGRLAPEAARAAADTEMNGIAGRLAAEYPEAYKTLRGVLIETFTERFNGGPIRAVFLSMLGAVGFVLLIACANVANLQLSRSLERSREIGIRIAMGASRLRIVRQLLVESILLGAIGGLLGLGLTAVGVRLFDAAVAGTGKPYWIIFSIDSTVFGYLAGLCVLAGVLFGLAPALHVSRTNINGILKEGGRGTTGGRRERWVSSVMVVVELALTIVLLAGAGLMIRSFLQLYASDRGFRTEGLMGMRVQLSGTTYASAEARRLFFERLEPKLETIPGAQAAALTTSVPPFPASRRPFEVEGGPVRGPEETPPEIAAVSISPRFFEVLGVNVLRGRAFHDMDGSPGSETAIINERLAAQYFAGEDPLGRRIRFVPRTPPSAAAPPPTEPWRTIVGISPTLRHNPPQDAEPRAAVYVPFRLDSSVMLLVRGSGDPGTIMQAVRREVQAIDRDQPVLTIQTLDQMLANSMWPYRVFGSLFAIFAAIGLLLSAVGLYGVMAYGVSQRTPEIGIRMALGAGSGQVSWLFLRRGLVQLALGLGLGLGGALLLSGAIESLLVRVPPRDPLTLAVITLLLTLVGVAACVIPARRATRVDPLVALRD